MEEEMERMDGGCSGDCSSCGEAEKEPEAEVGEEVKEEESVSAPAEEAPVEEVAPVEEAPAEEPVAEEKPAEEPAESCECCSVEETKSAEDLVRDLVNQVNVLKEEEKLGVTTRVDPVAADELVAKLEELAVKVGEICKCD